ncbi:MAG: exonuclease SbcCD subunit D [Methanomassiliicoccales archaeon]|nr:exonuclease SbcCD subunit D [Methanomassiliicoccales archaeon]
MKIAHVSDTHIGYSAYARVDESTGLNQREIDVFDSFERFIDRIIQIRPDAVLHSGDLFDSVRPTNRAISFVLDQLRRLAEVEIPSVVIAGNHSTPRLQETGSVFRILEHMDGIHPVYKGAYERVDLGDITVHAIPHSDGDNLIRNLQSMIRSKDAKFNIGMLHAGIIGLGVFRMNEFNETLVQSSYLRKDMDYIALGHYHGCCEVAPNAWYAGSTERFSFAEAQQDKGFMLVDLEKGSKVFVPLMTRRMIDLAPIDALNLDSLTLRAEIAGLIESSDLDDNIVRMRIKNLAPSLYKTLDFNWIRHITTTATHFELKYDLLQEGSSIQMTSTALDSLDREFVSFLERFPVEKANKEVVRTMGLSYLHRGMEESD